MITLVTGYNDTGKTTWICEIIAKQLKRNVETELIDNHHYNISTNSLIYFGDTVPIELSAYEIDHYPYSKYLSGIKKGVKHPYHINYPERRLGHPSVYQEWVNRLINYAKGYDIYIETHSDHILNAIRIAVAEQRLNVDDVKILFFKSIDDITVITINEYGDLSDWVDGFFDQQETDYLNLVKLKKDVNIRKQLHHK